MALSKLNTNGIMTGYVNHFCFACERHFKSEEDAYKHLDKGIHVKNMATIAYADKFKGESIRKVKNGYYCEYCNTFLNTAAKAAMHVKEADHTNHKGYAYIKRLDSGVLVDNKVLIRENAWHGITEDSCALCNIDFDDEDIHKNLPLHVINLVASKVEFGPNTVIYRRIDASSFQCLSCNTVYSMNILEQHFNDSTHKDNINNYLYTPPVKNEDQQPSDKTVEETIKSNDTEKPSEIIESLQTFQKNDIEIDLVLEIAVCKKCNETIKVDINSIEEHISHHDAVKKSQELPLNTDHNGDKNSDGVNNTDIIESGNASAVNIIVESKDSPIDNRTDIATNSKESDVPKSEDMDVSAYAKENHLTYNSGQSNSYCRACHVKMPSSYRSLNEHVIGKVHQKNAAYMAKSVQVVPKVPMHAFVKTDIGFTGLFHDDIVINYKFCITLHSYHYITELERVVFGIRCNVCERTFPLPFFKEHIDEAAHREALYQTSVVTCLSDEFIREIRPGTFHCGYCNLLFQNWDTAKKHTTATIHKDQKTNAGKRLRCHMRDLAEHRKRKELQLMIMLLNGRFN